MTVQFKRCDDVKTDKQTNKQTNTQTNEQQQWRCSSNGVTMLKQTNKQTNTQTNEQQQWRCSSNDVTMSKQTNIQTHKQQWQCSWNGVTMSKQMTYCLWTPFARYLALALMFVLTITSLIKYDPNTKRLKRKLIYFNTDTQYAHFRGNPLYRATKR